MNGAIAQLTLDWSHWTMPFTERWWQETACSVLVGIACGLLGCFVVLRRMALIGDALSHAVLPGVVIAFILTGSTDIVRLFLGALLAGLVAALLIRLVSQYSRTKEDSAIGIVFTGFFAAGIILVSSLPRGTHFDLQCFLWGDPLAVGSNDLILMAVVAPLVTLTIIVLYHPLRLASFDPLVAAAMGISVSGLHYLLMGLLSATVVAGLKTTGVILVVAMIITPASAAYQLANRLWTMLLLAGAFGAVSAAAGMSLAFVANSPTGPAMVVVATLIFGLSMILSPNHGLLFRILKRRQLAWHIAAEDVLKAVYKLAERAQAGSLSEITRSTGLRTRWVETIIGRLRTAGLITGTSPDLTLTEAGHRHAEELVRAHRLWESYLADRSGMDTGAIHDAAERLEHAHELAEEVDVALGRPRRDPHGEAIPPPPAPQK